MHNVFLIVFLIICKMAISISVKYFVHVSLAYVHHSLIIIPQKQIGAEVWLERTLINISNSSL